MMVDYQTQKAPSRSFLRTTFRTRFSVVCVPRSLSQANRVECVHLSFSLWGQMLKNLRDYESRSPLFSHLLARESSIQLDHKAQARSLEPMLGRFWELSRACIESAC